MQNRNSKRLTVIILGILTIVIGTIAVLVGIQLQRSQAPTDSNASNTCRGGTVNEAGAAGNGVQCLDRVANQSFVGADGVTQVQCQPGADPDNGLPNYDTCFLRVAGGGGGNNGGGLQCPNRNSDGTTSQVVTCIALTCPNGDTNGDGQCTAADTGATQQGPSLAACSARPACGQVDAFKGNTFGSGGTNTGDYCGYFYLNINCGSGTTTSTPPARGVCSSLERNPAGVPTDEFPASTPFTVTATYNQCSSVVNSMRLFVFRSNENGGATLTSQYLQATLAASSTTGPNSNNRCTYTFNWNGQVTDSSRYRFRVGRLGSDGQFDPARLDNTDVCGTGATLTVAGQSQCGGVCGSNGNQCPNNHTCSNNVCVLNTCLTNPASCQADRCTPVVTTTSRPTTIPNTGLFDADGRPLLIGLILIIFGLVYNRLNGRVNLFGAANLGEKSRLSNRYAHKVDAENKLEKPKSKKKDNKSFEEKLLGKNKN